MLALYVVMPCGLIRKYQPSVETYCLNLRGINQYVPPKRWYAYSALQLRRPTSKLTNLIYNQLIMANSEPTDWFLS